MSPQYAIELGPGRVVTVNFKDLGDDRYALMFTGDILDAEDGILDAVRRALIELRHDRQRQQRQQRQSR